MRPTFFNKSTNNQSSKNNHTVECGGPSQLASLDEPIANKIEKYGFCIVNAWDSSEEVLRMVSNRFGNIQHHVRANENGVAGEGQSQVMDWKLYKEEYAGVGQEEFYPHSDGSFLNGMMVEEGVMQSVHQPKLILLQCAKQAENGGQNYLVDGKRVLEDILEGEPEILNTLFSPGAITFCRDEMLAVHVPVYEMVENKINIRFRYDFATYAPAWSLPVISKLHHDYHLNQKYRILIDLYPNQILIVDNLRMLHARMPFKTNAISGERILRRTWIFDDNAPQLHNVEGKVKKHRATLPYLNYHMKRRPLFSPHSSIMYKAGISLSSNKLKKLLTLINHTNISSLLPPVNDMEFKGIKNA